MKICPRLIYSLASFFSLSLVAFSFYLQYYQALEPCPLCIIQRWLIGLLGLLCLISIVYRSRFYGGLITFVALMGTGSALRKIWLEHLPSDQVPPCGPGLDYMLNYLPFEQTLKILLMGSGDCSNIEWHFLSLSLSQWALLSFLVFLGLGLWQLHQNAITR